MYAQIERDLSAVIQYVRQINPIPPDTGTGPYWVPVYRIIDDQSTTDEVVLEPETVVITSTRVNIVRVKRDMTAQELDVADEEIAIRTINNKGILRAIAKVLFLIVNDVRELKGQGSITQTQFKDYIKGLIR